MRTTIDKRLCRGVKATFIEKDSEIISITKKQLDEYFSYKRKTFCLPLLMIGTKFQKRVWTELLQIKFGSTLSYLGLAEKVANKNAVRAVANANGANAISIIIPCHRIIGSNGALTGYAGGLQAKHKLLSIEQDLFARR